MSQVLAKPFIKYRFYNTRGRLRFMSVFKICAHGISIVYHTNRTVFTEIYFMVRFAHTVQSTVEYQPHKSQ